jgi:hypothetical protein
MRLAAWPVDRYIFKRTIETFLQEGTRIVCLGGDAADVTFPFGQAIGMRFAFIVLVMV